MNNIKGNPHGDQNSYFNIYSVRVHTNQGLITISILWCEAVSNHTIDQTVRYSDSQIGTWQSDEVSGTESCDGGHGHPLKGPNIKYHISNMIKIPRNWVNMQWIWNTSYYTVSDLQWKIKFGGT